MNIKNNKSIQVWIGFIHVKPKLNKISSLDGAIGAFFTGLVLAKNQKDYIDKLTDFLQEEGLEIIETEDVEPYEEYQKKYNAPKEICGLVENLSEDKPIAVNRFDSYENE